MFSSIYHFENNIKIDLSTNYLYIKKASENGLTAMFLICEIE